MADRDHVTSPYLPVQRFWAVGCQPAKFAHRVVGRYPGNDARLTACGVGICLHGSPWGGWAFENVDAIPRRYRLCRRCVDADETVE